VDENALGREADMKRSLLLETAREHKRMLPTSKDDRWLAAPTLDSFIQFLSTHALTHWADNRAVGGWLAGWLGR
jgi:hypothetical protein